MLLEKFKQNPFLLAFLFFPIAFVIGQAAISIIFVYLIIIFIKDFKKIKFINNTEDYYLIFFFLIIIFSSIWNYFNEHKNFHSILSSFLYIKFLIPYYLIRTVKIDNLFFENLRKIFLFVSIVILFVIIDTIFQHHNPSKLDLFGYRSTLDNANRLTGPFGNDEAIPGSFLIKIGFVTLVYFNSYFFYKFKKKFYLAIIPIMNVIFLYVILITGERIAFMMSILAFSLLFIILNKQKKNLFFSAIVSILVIFFVIEKNPYIKSRYEVMGKFLFSKNYHSYDVAKVRENHMHKKNSINFFNNQWGAHYLTSLEILKDKPFFGAGIKGFRMDCKKKEYENIRSLSFYKRCSSHPHNIYFEFLSETGLVGSFFILTFLFIIIIKNYKLITFLKKKKLNYEDQIILSIYVAALVVLISILWPIRSSGSFFSNFNGSMIWINIYWILLIEKYFKKNNKI